MNTDYERYGHLGVPLNPTHTSAALDAAHELTEDLTRTIQTLRKLLRVDETATLNTVLAAYWAHDSERMIDELRTNLADLLSVCLPSDLSEIDYLPVGMTLNLSAVDPADIENLRKMSASRITDEEFEVIEDVFDPEHYDVDLTADDGWHFGGVVTATPDGVVVSQADPDERDELIICF